MRAPPFYQDARAMGSRLALVLEAGRRNGTPMIHTG